MDLISIFSIFGLAFLIKESDGPFDIMSKLRNYLMINRVVGVFFYKLLSCFFCVGCHAGWIVYFLYNKDYNLKYFIVWTLAGGAISLIMDALLNKLHSNSIEISNLNDFSPEE